MNRHIDALVALSQSRSFGPHIVFAGLYVQTNRHLLACFDKRTEPAFCYLVMIRFFELYDRHVVQPVQRGEAIIAPHWQDYAALADRLTLDSAVNDAARLMVRGARAHVLFDLGVAIELAVNDHVRLFGFPPNLPEMRKLLLGGETSRAFFKAALVFNRLHRRRSTGRRRLILHAHAMAAWLSRSWWLFVLQSWRRAAWNDAMRALRASLSAPTEARQTRFPVRLFRSTTGSG